jgi:hypothetical protein
MKVFFDHNFITSFALWLDNKLCNDAQAYNNFGNSTLYHQPILNGHSWSSPYRSWIYDSSVSGATIISGVYNSSGQFLTRSSGIVFDFNNARVLSKQNWGPKLSGSFAQKEFNIYTSTEQEIDFLLESIYKTTGIAAGKVVAPCVILTSTNEFNQAYALGGLECTKNTIKGYIVSNNNFLQVGINSFFRDLSDEYVPLVSFGDAPITSSGDLKTGYYSYGDLMDKYGVSSGCIYIAATHLTKIPQSKNNSTNFYASIVEFDTETLRQPRESK